MSIATTFLSAFQDFGVCPHAKLATPDSKKEREREREREIYIYIHMCLYRGRESKGGRGKQNLWDLMQLLFAGAESHNPQFSALHFGASLCRRVDVGLSGLARCDPSLEWKMNTPRNETTATATATGAAPASANC